MCWGLRFVVFYYFHSLYLSSHPLQLTDSHINGVLSLPWLSSHLHWTPNTHFWLAQLIVLQLKCWDKEALKGTWSTDGNQEKSLTGRHPSFLVESAADSWWVRHLMPPQTKWKQKQSVLLQCPFDMYIYTFVCTLQMQSFCCWLFTYLSICFRVQQKMGFTFLAKDENGVKNKRKNSQASSAKNR